MCGIHEGVCHGPIAVENFLVDLISMPMEWMKKDLVLIDRD